MKILVALTPQLRPFDYLALETLERRVIKRLPAKPDLIAHFGPPQLDYIQTLANSCTLREIRFTADPDFSGKQWQLGDGIAGSNRIRNNLLQWHALEQVKQLKADIERKEGVYDLVLWSRPDLYFINDFAYNFTPLENTVWTSPHDCWGGYNDRFCYGTSSSMDRRMEIFDHFLTGFYPRRKQFWG